MACCRGCLRFIGQPTTTSLSVGRMVCQRVGSLLRTGNPLSRLLLSTGHHDSPKNTVPPSSGKRVLISHSPHKSTLIMTKYAKKSKHGDDSPPTQTHSTERKNPCTPNRVLAPVTASYAPAVAIQLTTPRLTLSITHTAYAPGVTKSTIATLSYSKADSHCQCQESNRSVTTITWQDSTDSWHASKVSQK